MRPLIITAIAMAAGCTGTQLDYSRSMQRATRAAAAAAQVVAEELEAQARPAAEARARTQHAQLSDQYDACLVAGRTDCQEPLSEQLILADYLTPWVRLVAVTEAMGQLTSLWGRMNISWRANATAPPDWNSRLCQPLAEAIDVAMVLLDRLGTEVAGVWRVMSVLAPEVCRIGAEAAEGQ